MKPAVKKELTTILILFAFGMVLSGLSYYLGDTLKEFYADSYYISVNSVLIIYMFGGLAGAVYEFLLYFFRDKQLVCTTGSLFAPFNFMYGIGAVAVVLVMFKIENAFFIYLLGTILSGALEFLISFLEEKIGGSRSWNYEKVPFNIKGRTSLTVMAVWGMLAVFILQLVYRPLASWLITLNSNALNIVCYCLFAYVILDMLLSYPAYFRFIYRVGKGSSLKTNAFTRFYDRLFNDKFMKSRYPKTRIGDKYIVIENGKGVMADEIIPARNFAKSTAKIKDISAENLDGKISNDTTLSATNGAESLDGKISNDTTLNATNGAESLDGKITNDTALSATNGAENLDGEID